MLLLQVRGNKREKRVEKEVTQTGASLITSSSSLSLSLSLSPSSQHFPFLLTVPLFFFNDLILYLSHSLSQYLSPSLSVSIYLSIWNSCSSFIWHFFSARFATLFVNCFTANTLQRKKTVSFSSLLFCIDFFNSSHPSITVISLSLSHCMNFYFFHVSSYLYLSLFFLIIFPLFFFLLFNSMYYLNSILQLIIYFRHTRAISSCLEYRHYETC